MFSLLRLFWPICQLQRGPQDLPVEPVLFRLALLACFITGLLAGSILLPLPFADVLIRVSVSLAISLALWHLLIRLTGRQARLTQTLTAVFGCASLLNAMIWLTELTNNALGGTMIGMSLLREAIVLWSVVVNGHILRHVLEWPLLRSIALAFLLFALRFGIYWLIFS